jgi:L-lactate dehydrogenase
MACARIAEILLRDEPAVIPIASYNPEYGVTLSLLSVLGRSGAAMIIEPPMSDKEREALKRSADTLKSALARIQFSPS